MVSRAQSLKTLCRTACYQTQKQELQNNRFKEHVRPASWDGGPLRGFYFFFRDRMCATTAFTSSSDSFALNAGMNFPLPFFMTSAI